MDTETNPRPLIQIDDIVRPMTDEEYAAYLDAQSKYVPLMENNNDRS